MLPVVVVDDSREDALLTQRIIAECKIQNPCVLLFSGRACLDYFMAAPPFQNRTLPCLLLLDMVMPKLSGIDTLRELKALPTVRDSVLVMLSGLPDWRMIHGGYQLGAETFLVKPIIAEDLMHMFRSIRSLVITALRNGFQISLREPTHAMSSSAFASKSNPS